LRITCNRGASGIDGNVATLLGMASASRQPVVGLLGDLTLIHDIGSLATAKGLNATLLVLDNGGGGIFDHLPQAVLPEHDALFTTTQAVDLGSITTAFGLNYHTTRPSQIVHQLSQTIAQKGVSLLHIKLDRVYSHSAHQKLWRRLEQTRTPH
jgi:2-succinyl-5-enolpyruvyl-6-hydroxy-3-cyclohexene-1-carboxylate synthase